MGTIVFFRDLERRIVETEMEITLAKSQGFHSNQLKSSSNKKFLAVIGIYTGFGYSLRKLEERGIVIRFIIDRSPNRGFSLDRNIEEENRTTKDFFKTVLQSSFVGNGDDYFNDLREFKSSLKLLKDKQILMHSLMVVGDVAYTGNSHSIYANPESSGDRTLPFPRLFYWCLLLHIEFYNSGHQNTFNEFPSFMENNKSSDEVNWSNHNGLIIIVVGSFLSFPKDCELHKALGPADDSFQNLSIGDDSKSKTNGMVFYNESVENLLGVGSIETNDITSEEKGGKNGASWAFELGGDLKVCPIIVEDLQYPGHMIIEMICNESSRFLEIGELHKHSLFRRLLIVYKKMSKAAKQGIGILLSDLFGTETGSSVSIENAGLLVVTSVGS
ncbi:unnamed protein product [Lactuca virosa]|uniref:Uncharacterized protein n=1 Tax=Lactuca virosa TaxID=75947 RepID=A0AAU9MUM1_9ASTR|nr:unnamed protein product [Lactuca virosa]